MTWGDAEYGGDSSVVHGQLRMCSNSEPLRRLVLLFWMMDSS